MQTLFLTAALVRPRAPLVRPTRAPRVVAFASRIFSTEVDDSSSGKLSLEPLTDEDLAVIEERQLGHQASNIIGVGLRCKHGHPQAFAFDPVGRAPWRGGERKSSLESGLFRLSCPHLVKAIDEWEKEGAVKSINDEVRGSAMQEDDDEQHDASTMSNTPTLANMLEKAHEGHMRARHAIIGDRMEGLVESAKDQGEEKARIVDMILESGIAGQTPSKVDIKCVHAQVGDHLCRSRSNEVAAELLRRLEARGAAADGCSECSAQCNLKIPQKEAQSTWWYEPTKNKWKLRKLKRKRAAKKAANSHDWAGDEVEDEERPDRASG